MSYSGVKHFIKETRIWTLKYPFQVQKKWTEIHQKTWKYFSWENTELHVYTNPSPKCRKEA